MAKKWLEETGIEASLTIGSYLEKTMLLKCNDTNLMDISQAE